MRLQNDKARGFLMALLGRHIYCIIDGEEEVRFPVEGVGGEDSEIYSIPVGGMAAVVGESISGPILTMNKEELVQKLAAHQAVVEKVMEGHSVLPVKFGTLARDDSEVSSILTEAAGRLRELLDATKGKIEEDVVAFWNKSFFEDVMREEPDIRKARDEVIGKGKKATMEDRVRIGQMLATALAGRKARYTEEILKFLGDYSLDIQQNRIVRDDMIINAAFLLEKEKEEVFDRKVHELNDRYNERIDFRCVGPLPPYSFSTVEISRFSFEEVDAARKRLGLDSTADTASVKEAHLKLVAELHPDRRQSEPLASKEFEEVTKAFQLVKSYCEHGGVSFEKEDVENNVVVRVLEIDST